MNWFVQTVPIEKGLLVVAFLSLLGFATLHGMLLGQALERKRWFIFYTPDQGKTWLCNGKPLPVSYLTDYLQDHWTETEVPRLEMSLTTLGLMGYPKGPLDPKTHTVKMNWWSWYR